MSLQSRIANPPPFRALPLWRRIVLLLGLAFSAFVGAMVVNYEYTIYGDPGHPVPQTGHIYPIQVIHGSLRYATLEEKSRLVFWEQGMGAWVGLPFLGLIFLWLLYRPRRA